MGKGRGLRGPRSPTNIKLLVFVPLFLRGRKFANRKKRTEHVGQLFRLHAAHLRPAGAETRPKEPISGLRGLVTGLKAQSRPRGVGVAAGEDVPPAQNSGWDVPINREF